ncbi:MAG TPA: hypothetical protein VEO19_02660 [Terriglobia bacterium]|nr:hypothetical protein [Terriglobia bacterium]
MAAIAWPICALVFAIFFVLRFQKHIGYFIDRTKSISKKGVEADPTGIVVQNLNDIAKASPAEELLHAFDNQLLLEQEGLITRHLETSKIQNSADRERVLVRYLAASQLVLRFESVYQSIWGSQLRALQQLNESTPHGVPLAGLEPWYELGKAFEPAWYASYTFEQWYGFMESIPLVVNQAGTVHISVMGREFLKYLVDCGYAPLKRG